MLIEDFRGEFQRYRSLGERALAQIPDDALNLVPSPEGNSAAMIMRHVGGNLLSRFTDFLTTDGEKPDRDREREFEIRSYTRAEADSWWAKGWSAVESALAELKDEDLTSTVSIRRQPLSAHAALCRSLAHISYHVGQLVLLARMYAAGPWESLSIPRGDSEAFNRKLGMASVPKRS